MPLTNPIFRRISRLAEEQGVRAFVVGGYVRDHFLRRPSTDIDVVVVGSGIALAEALGRELHAKVSVFKTFGTAMLRHKGVEVEFVGARRESYTQDSRKPQVEAGTLEDDQRRRDFTINAMAWSLNAGSFGELVDPFDGMDDLEECVIRTPCDPDVTFSDDPLRRCGPCASRRSWGSRSKARPSTPSAAMRTASGSCRANASLRNSTRSSFRPYPRWASNCWS